MNRFLQNWFHERMLNSIADVYNWEKFVRTELSFLNTFEFCFFDLPVDDIMTLDFLVAPSQQPFWHSEKCWTVVCRYILDWPNTISLCTVPFTAHAYCYKDFSIYGTLLMNNNYYITKSRKSPTINAVACNVSNPLFEWKHLQLITFFCIIITMQ